MLFPEDGDGGGAPDSSETLLSEGSGDDVSWYDPLPDDLKSTDVVTKHKSLDTFVKSAIHAASMVGRDKVALPAKEDDPSWNEVWNKLGRPEKAEGYQMPEDLQLHESVQIPEETVGAFREKAYELGLSQRQAAGLYGWFMQDVSNGAEAQFKQSSEARVENIANLKREFGQAFDERLDMAKAAIKQFGGDELSQVMNETGLGDHPAMVKAFVEIGKALADEKLYQSGERPGMRRSLSPEEATNEIVQLQTDPQFLEAYMNSENAAHQEAVDRMAKLHQAAAAAP